MNNKLYLPYTTVSRSRDITNAFQNIKQPMEDLMSLRSKSKIKEIIKELRTKSGLKDISSDSVCFTDGKRIITLVSSNCDTYEISEQNLSDKTQNKTISVVHDILCKADGFNGKDILSSVSSFLNEVFAELDFPMLKVRQFFKSHTISDFMETFVAHPKLSDLESRILNEIQVLFNEINESYSTVKSASTRAYIRKSYPNMKSQDPKRLYEFSHIGENGEDYAINIVKDRLSKINIVIQITNTNGEVKNVIVEPDGAVLKSKSVNNKCNLGEKKYYTKEELRSLNLYLHLGVLKRELQKFKEYTLKKVQGIHEFQNRYSTNEIGEIDSQSIKMLKEIQEKYNKLKMIFERVLQNSEQKESAKRKLGISTRSGSPSITYRNVGKNKEIIQLSFPIIGGKQCTKILVLNSNDDVRKSFFIEESKLVKFDAANMSRSKRTDIKTNYYSQEEIDNSELKLYLGLLYNKIQGIEQIITRKKKWYE